MRALSEPGRAQPFACVPSQARTSDTHSQLSTQRLTVRGDLDRAYLALRVLSQEREKLDQVASAVANASPDATPVRAKL